MESKIVLIGLSDKQIEQLPEGIQGIQRTENVEALVEWYNKASVFVNPTYVDNFPTTNIEALACGTPVVTYHTGGSPEAIDHQTGAVVDKGDIKALSKAVLAMFKNKATVKACRERAGNKFNSNERYTDYLRLYQEIINHG
jgi:glycosyltransferase involved in cell wall biosynthesis